VIKRLHHIGIVVDDLEEGKRFLGEVLGLSLVTEREVPQRRRRTAFYKCGEVEIEIILDLDAPAKQRSLDGAAARIEHIALEVDNVEETVKELAPRGVRIGEGGLVQIGSRLNAWTEPASTDGVMYQLTGAIPQSAR
jgi:methylmalonyl-CoA/ethylmalonyl-CoA epimerase